MNEIQTSIDGQSIVLLSSLEKKITKISCHVIVSQFYRKCFDQWYIHQFSCHVTRFKSDEVFGGRVSNFPNLLWCDPFLFIWKKFSSDCHEITEVLKWKYRVGQV